MKELDVVRLKANYKDIAAGTLGTIVLEYDGNYFEVEVVDTEGDTLDVLTTPANILELVSTYNY